MRDDTVPSAALDSRLDIDELAREADTTPERLKVLVGIAAIRADEHGQFGRGDVIRSRLLAAFEAEGVSLDHIAVGIRERAITLDFIDLFYPDPSPPSAWASSPRRLSCAMAGES